MYVESLGLQDYFKCKFIVFGGGVAQYFNLCRKWFTERTQISSPTPCTWRQFRQFIQLYLIAQTCLNVWKDIMHSKKTPSEWASGWRRGEGFFTCSDQSLTFALNTSCTSLPRPHRKTATLAPSSLLHPPPPPPLLLPPLRGLLRLPQLLVLCSSEWEPETIGRRTIEEDCHQGGEPQLHFIFPAYSSQSRFSCTFFDRHSSWLTR